MRATIREAAPEAEEAISYQIPTFKLNGNLVQKISKKRTITLSTNRTLIVVLFSYYLGGSKVGRSNNKKGKYENKGQHLHD